MYFSFGRLRWKQRNNVWTSMPNLCWFEVLDEIVFCRNVAGIAGRDKQVPASVAFVGSGDPTSVTTENRRHRPVRARLAVLERPSVQVEAHEDVNRRRVRSEK